MATTSHSITPTVATGVTWPCGNMESPFFDCPTEMVINIICQMDLKGVFACSQTCKRFYDIIKGSLVIKYYIELQAGGFIDNPHSSSHLTPADRLELLAERQRRWRSLDWRQTHRHPLREGCPIYELYGGAFAQLWDSRGSDPEERRRRLNVLYLPSEARKTKELTKISHFDADPGTVRELGVDPDQDLLMLVKQVTVPEPLLPRVPNWKLVISFWSLSTDERHPASCPSGTLEFCPPLGSPTGGQCRLVLLLVGDMVALLFSDFDTTTGIFTIWRWTTGQKLLTLETPSLAFDFTFLTDDIFVIPGIKREDDIITAAIHTYRLPESLNNPANDDGHDPSEAIVKQLAPEVTFLLPELNSAVISGYRIVSRAHPQPSPRKYVPPNRTFNPDFRAPVSEDTPRSSIPSCPPPFQTGTSDGLITFSFIFNIRYDDPLGQGDHAWQEAYVLCTHVSSLLSHHPFTSPALEDIPWSAWSHQARWIPDHWRRNWYSHTYGYRFVKPYFQPARDHRDAFAIQVLDFNPYTVKREMAKQDSERLAELLEVMKFDNDSKLLARWRLVTEPTLLKGHVFKEVVKTSLPYIEVTSVECLLEFTGLMMCEEHVLSIGRDFNDFTYNMQLDVFCV